MVYKITLKRFLQEQGLVELNEKDSWLTLDDMLILVNMFRYKTIVQEDSIW